MSERSSDGRGQVSLTVVEATVGVVLVLAASALFLVGHPDTGGDEAELSVLAADGLTALDATPPTDDREGASRLHVLVSGQSGFTSERGRTGNQLQALYPPGIRYRLETPHGVIGSDRQPGATVGRATRTVSGTRVTLWVWYR